MKPPDVALRELVGQWIRKAESDCEAASHLLPEGERFRGIIAFHCQQAVEKYLKAFLVLHQVEFPKTHDIGKLLGWVAGIDAPLAEALRDADSLTPFGVEVRYPTDAPELLPGGETTALDIARRVKAAVMARLEPYLGGGSPPRKRG
jgi:HEPN domain-containing protein